MCCWLDALCSPSCTPSWSPSYSMSSSPEHLLSIDGRGFTVLNQFELWNLRLLSHIEQLKTFNSARCMYLPALLEMAIEEEAADERTQRNSRGSGSGTSVANNTTAATPDSVDADAIETIEASDDKSFDEVAAAEDETEREPLQGPSKEEELSGETKVSLEDDTDNPKAKKWDKKCGIIGILLMLVILSGALAGILMNKFASQPAYQFQFANFYGSHMVLQRAPHNAVVWGYGPLTKENRTITLKIAGPEMQEHIVSIVNTIAGPVWKVVLFPIDKAGPFDITVSLEGQEGVIELKDVLFGDVWVCAGQTNMQYSMGLLEEVTEEEVLSDLDDYKDVRIMTVGSDKSNVEWYDVQSIQLPWSLPSRDTLASPNVPSTQFSSHFSALCWLYGKQLHDRLNYPIGLVSATYSASALEDWVSHDVIQECDINVPHATSMVYNAILHPLLSFSFYGAIWYQGESDALQLSGRLSGRYNCTFVNMIQDLRRKLYDNTMGSTDIHFPFGFVQLAPNREGDHLTFGFTDIRWQQTANYGYVPNHSMNKTFMAVAIDLPDVNSTLRPIHSRYKQDVADRLVSGALYVGYQQKDIVFQGPRPVKYSLHQGNHSMVIYMKAVGIELRENKGFEVCCSENRSLPCPSSYIKTSYAPGREWIQASVVSNTLQSVTLSFPECAARHPVAVRYLWRETPCLLRKCAVYDERTELPMPPFISQKLHSDGRWHDFINHQTDWM